MNEQNLKEKIAQYQFDHHTLYDIDQLSEQDIADIFDLAKEFESYLGDDNSKKTSILRGTSIINFFLETSTRTRTSFELAGKHLGSDTINVTGATATGKSKGETLIDMAKTLNSMKADLIILRNARAGTPQLISKHITAKVISAGDGWHQHPTQALTDLLTIRNEFGDNLKGLKITIVGDIKHSRVAGSLMRLLPETGAEVVLTGPATLMPEKVEEVFDVKVNTKSEEALKDADVIYSLRMQSERGADGDVPTIREYAHQYCINPTRLALAKKSAIVMHPGPVNREVDIRTAVIDGPQSRITHQVENGFLVRLALLSLMLGKNNQSA